MPEKYTVLLENGYFNKLPNKFACRKKANGIQEEPHPFIESMNCIVCSACQCFRQIRSKFLIKIVFLPISIDTNDRNIVRITACLLLKLECELKR